MECRVFTECNMDLYGRISLEDGLSSQNGSKSGFGTAKSMVFHGHHKALISILESICDPI